MSSPPHRFLRPLFVAAWAATVTLVMQFWVGGATIYRASAAPQIEVAHRGVISNRPPGGGTWAATGMNSTNIRVVAPFLAEFVHRATGREVTAVYRAIDTLALFIALLLLTVFLGRVAPPVYAALGTAGFAALLPLTYQLFYYHPWDRLSLLMWLLLLLALERRRYGWFAALLPVAVAIKFDIILLPGLAFLLAAPWPPRREGVLRAVALAAALSVVSFGTYWALQYARPGGFESFTHGPLMARNLRVLRELKLAYPPLLGFGVPLALAGIGFRTSDRFARACALFAVPLLVIFALRSNFAEFRAEVPVLLLLLPAVLSGVRWLCEPVTVSQTPIHELPGRAGA